MDETNDFIQLEAELGRRSLHDFVRLAWHQVEPGQEFVDTWSIGMLCEHYEACLRGEIDKLVVNIPPGMSKSRTTCVFFPTYSWLQDPGLRFLCASYDLGLTSRDAGDALELMQSKWFRDRWGDQFMLPATSPVRNIENNVGGWRFATSVAGKAVGRHANVQIIDDPVKPKGLTKTTLQDAKHWLQNTMASRWRKPGLNCRILIMQRLHTDDPAAHMISEGAVLVSLPMRYESVVRCETKWGADPRTEEGELLCPERYPETAVRSLEKDMGGMVVAAQLQQRPVPEGGATFKGDWLKQYWRVLPSKVSQWAFSWDCTFKGTDDSDFVVGQLWARVGSGFYLVDQVRDRKTFSETLAAIRAFKKKWAKVTAVLVEDKANGSAVIDTLQKEIPGIIPVDPEGGKEARANAVQPFFEAGNVWLPDPAMDGYEWVELEYKPEMVTFPMGQNDDQVDSTTQALVYLHKGRSYLADAMKKLRGT